MARMSSTRCAWALLPALLLAACGSANTAPAPSSAAANSTAAKPAASAAGSAKPAASAKPLAPVKSAYVAIGAHTLPIWLAQDKGLFKQQGLAVDVAYVQGSVTAIPAMSTGELQIIEATPAASVQAQLKGQDTVALATHIPYADYRLMVLPEIKTLNDLKGKTIGQVKAGTVDDVVVKYVLTKLGLTPGKDVNISYLGSQPAILAALKQKLIQGTAQSPPIDYAAQEAGAHELINILNEHFAYPVDGVIATRKFVREHPDETVAFLKGYVQGIRYIKANPDETKKELGARTQIDDPKVLDEGYTVMVQALADNPAPLTDDIATVLPLFDGQGKNPADFVDPAPLAKAIQELGGAKS
jgi:NitT/TauT family transport system substrate-binding protein